MWLLPIDLAGITLRDRAVLIRTRSFECFFYSITFHSFCCHWLYSTCCSSDPKGVFDWERQTRSIQMNQQQFILWVKSDSNTSLCSFMLTDPFMTHSIFVKCPLRSSYSTRPWRYEQCSIWRLRKGPQVDFV